MNYRQIEYIVKPGAFHMVGDGFYVTSFIGNVISAERMNPFIMMDYNPKTAFGPTDKPRGVGAHPHKGFETVTMAYHGKVAHKDNKGNYGIIGPGDVQWMTAGEGIVHQEFHEAEWAKNGGDFQMIQLWVNLPAKFKSAQPGYQELQYGTMPKVPVLDGKGEVCVIAGDYLGTKGAARTYTDMHLYNAQLQKGGQLTVDFPNHYNTGIVVVDGGIKINDGTAVEKDRFVLMENNQGSKFIIEATTPDTVIFILSGQPIQEPIVSYGPFVMNTQEEILQAYRDFNTGKYGSLEFD